LTSLGVDKFVVIRLMGRIRLISLIKNSIIVKAHWYPKIMSGGDYLHENELKGSSVLVRRCCWANGKT